MMSAEQIKNMLSEVGLKMGSLRIRQRLQELEKTTIHYD